MKFQRCECNGVRRIDGRGNCQVLRELLTFSSSCLPSCFASFTSQAALSHLLLSLWFPFDSLPFLSAFRGPSSFHSFTASSLPPLGRLLHAYLRLVSLSQPSFTSHVLILLPSRRPFLLFCSFVLCLLPSFLLSFPSPPFSPLQYTLSTKVYHLKRKDISLFFLDT